MSPEWIDDAAAESELWEGAGTSVLVRGRDIAVFRIGDAAYATDNLCTHGHARLCDGFVEGHEIECPLHQDADRIKEKLESAGLETALVRVQR